MKGERTDTAAAVQRWYEVVVRAEQRILIGIAEPLDLEAVARKALEEAFLGGDRYDRPPLRHLHLVSIRERTGVDLSEEADEGERYDQILVQRAGERVDGRA